VSTNYYDQLAADKAASDAAIALAASNQTANDAAFTAAITREGPLYIARRLLVSAVVADLRDNAGLDVQFGGELPDLLASTWAFLPLAGMHRVNQPHVVRHVDRAEAKAIGGGRTFWSIATAVLAVVIDDIPDPAHATLWVDTARLCLDVRLEVAGHDPRKSEANEAFSPIMLPFIRMKLESNVSDAQLREALAAAVSLGRIWMQTVVDGIDEAKPLDGEHPAVRFARDALAVAYVPYCDANPGLLL